MCEYVERCVLMLCCCYRSPQQLHRKPPFFKNECSVKSASAADASMSSPISVPLVAATSKSAEVGVELNVLRRLLLVRWMECLMIKMED